MTESEKRSKTIGEIVAEDYRTPAVFEKYGTAFQVNGVFWFFTRSSKRLKMIGI
ncbi:MAG: hypothetical protein RBR67_09565 [Desulfobacterium sp.]|nr:hypothetical protein [Desulfobacterium sp.]